jgi:SAM-dependent methyltransferase
MENPDSKVIEFKRRVEQEWAGDETAAAWQKYYPQMKEQLADVTKALVAAASPQPGMTILDLASGTGEPALSLARRVAPRGTVTATDLSQGMLNALKANANAESVTNIDTKVCDAHALPFPYASFDRVSDLARRARADQCPYDRRRARSASPTPEGGRTRRGFSPGVDGPQPS